MQSSKHGISAQLLCMVQRAAQCAVQRTAQCTARCTPDGCLGAQPRSTLRCQPRTAPVPAPPCQSPPLADLRVPRGRASARLALPVLGPGGGRKGLSATRPWNLAARAASGRARPAGRPRRGSAGAAAPGAARGTEGWCLGWTAWLRPQGGCRGPLPSPCVPSRPAARRSCWRPTAARPLSVPAARKTSSPTARPSRRRSCACAGRSSGSSSPRSAWSGCKSPGLGAARLPRWSSRGSQSCAKPLSAGL